MRKNNSDYWIFMIITVHITVQFQGKITVGMEKRNIIKNHLNLRKTSLPHTAALLWAEISCAIFREETNEVSTWNVINCMLLWITIMWIWQVVNLSLGCLGWSRDDVMQILLLFMIVINCCGSSPYAHLSTLKKVWSKSGNISTLIAFPFERLLFSSENKNI